MSVPLAPDVGRQTRLAGWPLAALAFGVAVGVLLIAYWQTVESLVWVWGHDGTYQYAFVIFPLGAWLAFTLRHRVAAHAPKPSVWGLVAAAVLVGVWYVGNVLAINVLQHFAFVALFPALVLACWGWRALWTLQFPLAYVLVFAVPWGDGLVGPLQDLTARMAVHALDITGVPVLLNGRSILTPSATWMVEAACSGVKFFFACTALGCLFAYLMYRRWWKRIGFVVLAAIVPVIANGLRVYFTILIGETFGLKYASGTDHMVFGWQFFGTVLLLLLVAGWFFRDRVVITKAPAPSNHTPHRARRVVWVLLLALLVAGPAVAAARVASAPAPRLAVVTPRLAGWQQIAVAPDGWQPAFHGAAGVVRATYRPVAGGPPVALYRAVYSGRPRDGHSLITYGNDVYNHADARVLSTAPRQIVLADGSRVAATELRLADRRGARLVWYWYCVNDRCSASKVRTKMLLAWQVLRGRVPRSAVWALSMPVPRGEEAAVHVRDALRAFAGALPAAAAAGVNPHRASARTGAEP